MIKKEKIYICDFENDKDGKVIYWYLENISSSKDNMSGDDIFSFFDFIFLKSEKQKIILYFHNLTYDGQFIITYLLKSGYNFTNSVSLKKNYFNCYVSDSGKIYNIKIKNKNYIKIYDSKNIIDYSIEDLSNKINMYKKIKIDFENLNFEKLKKRCQNDVKTVIYYLKPIIKKYGGVSTSSKMSFNNFIKNTDYGKYRKFLTPLIDPKIYKYIRRAFVGGICFLKQSCKNKILDNVNVYDINSMYPSIMADEQLPFGTPYYFKGKYKKNDIYNLYIQHIKCDFKIKKGKMPFVKDARKGYNNIDIGASENSNYEMIDLYLTDRELKLFVENYEIRTIQFVDGFMFQSCNFFSKYIKKMYSQKIKYKKAKDVINESIVKIFINSLFGTFGKKLEYNKKIPYIDNGGVLQYKTDVIKLNTQGVYLPIAIYITSYARCKIIKEIQKDYDNFIYCDTDSIHTFGKIEDVDDYKLGFFKLESKNAKAKYIKEKCYIMKEKNKDLKVVISGLGQYGREQVNFDNFKKGAIYDNLKPKRTMNGVMLDKDQYKIY